MKHTKNQREKIFSKEKIPAGVEDIMKVYERFREANAATEHYLEIISPKTHQSNSNQSIMTENR